MPKIIGFGGLAREDGSSCKNPKIDRYNKLKFVVEIISHPGFFNAIIKLEYIKMFCVPSRLLQQIHLSYKDFRILSVANLSSGKNEVSPEFVNRNPRNLEKLRIARKPSGYHLEAPGREFWHKLTLDQSSHHITAKVVHNAGNEVVIASTKEWKKKGYEVRTTDTSAYINLARVFAQRCLESGITEVYNNLKPKSGGKVDAFLKTLEENGLALSEPSRFKPYTPWDWKREEKPWEIIE
ncbi:hypothetical protein L9F63_002409 [Diploptera punctata]|uniref:Large ribosomal subunit protein uL18m n=1 Tax=Diploptera punctata TaxID=6984 RepID=A0AAD7ZSF4_DIPPU|nr:hypothetical protein L9F63_002409 [Diploptera punctata]